MTQLTDVISDSTNCYPFHNVANDEFVTLKPGFHMVVNMSQQCRNCRRDRLFPYLYNIYDTVTTHLRPYGNQALDL